VLQIGDLVVKVEVDCGFGRKDEVDSGSGSFGTVYCAKIVNTKRRRVAVKVFKKLD
jgi:hypothetical protein